MRKNQSKFKDPMYIQSLIDNVYTDIDELINIITNK